MRINHFVYVANMVHLLNAETIAESKTDQGDKALPLEAMQGSGDSGGPALFNTMVRNIWLALPHGTSMMET